MLGAADFDGVTINEEIAGLFRTSANNQGLDISGAQASAEAPADVGTAQQSGLRGQGIDMQSGRNRCSGPGQGTTGDKKTVFRT